MNKTAQALRMKTDLRQLLLFPARIGLLLGAARITLQYLGLLKSRSRPSRPIFNVDFLRALCFRKLGEHGSTLEALKEELRLHPRNAEADKLLHALLPSSHANRPLSLNPQFDEILEQVRPYTMLSEERLLGLLRGGIEVCENEVPGDFIECGVAAGGSAVLLAWVIRNYSRTERKVYAFDTYEGLPAPDAVDTHAGQNANKLGWGRGTCAAPIASLLTIATQVGVRDIVKPVKGLFEHTLPATVPSITAISLLHLDGDWYRSTMEILENCYEKVSHNGYIQIDDFGYWAGCSKAVKDFEQARNLRFALIPIDACAVATRKARH